jgi:hypothetical protein
MTTFGYRRADLLARCPDQLDCLKRLFGWRNLVRLPSETIQRNPDRPEVHHTAERFKAVPGEPVVTEKLPYDLKVVGPGEVNGPPVPIQEPFEHLSRQIALEDIGALENSRIRMLGRSSWIEFRIVHAGSAGGLLSGSPKLQALAYSSHAASLARISAVNGRSQGHDAPGTVLIPPGPTALPHADATRGLPL